MKRIALLLLCALLAACSSGPVRRVSEPAANIQQLTVRADGSWMIDLRIDNFSSVPMRFDAVALKLAVAGEDAGTLQGAPALTIGPESADVASLTLAPTDPGDTFGPVPEPMLSTLLTNFSAEDPGGWDWVFQRAAAAERVGIDRLAVSDHLVFGEHLEAYARPELSLVEVITSPERTETLKEIVAEFEAANPGVTVEITSLPWGQAFEKFATMVSAPSRSRP